MILIFDTNILISLVTSPNSSEEANKCQQWAYQMFNRGCTIKIPDICEYEIRRGLLFAKSKNPDLITKKIKRLDSWLDIFDNLSLTREVLLEAADKWAFLQKQGKIRAKGVDVDILVLSHLYLERKLNPGRRVVIVTTNIRDFILIDKNDASCWKDISL